MVLKWCSPLWNISGKFVNDNTPTVYIKCLRDKFRGKSLGSATKYDGEYYPPWEPPASCFRASGSFILEGHPLIQDAMELA